MTEVPVVVPSHRRAGSVRVLDVVANATLVVAESQEKEYRLAYPDAPIETHPDEVVGICPKRQWMLEHFGDHFSVDDDVKGLRRIYDPEAPPHLEPNEAYEAIQRTAELARDVGAKLWGFSNYPMTYTYDVFKPFKLIGYVNCMSYGIFADSKLWFPDDPEHLGDDYHVSGLNAYWHRYIWLDTRFAFEQTKTFRNPGGLSEFRESRREKATFDKLRAMFGDAIKLKTTRGGRPPDTSDERKSTTAGHSFEKLLVVPWG